MSEEKLSKDEVLAHLDKDWSKFLKRLYALKKEQRKSYLEQMEYESMRDLLTYLCGYWSGTLWMVSLILTSSSPDGDVQVAQIDVPTQEYFVKLEAEAYKAYKKSFPDKSKDLKEKFAKKLKKFRQFLKKLPKSDFYNTAVYSLILNATVTLYEKYAPPPTE